MVSISVLMLGIWEDAILSRGCGVNPRDAKVVDGIALVAVGGWLLAFFGLPLRNILRALPLAAGLIGGIVGLAGLEWPA